MARRANRCHGCVTQAIAAMITTKLASERATMQLASEAVGEAAPGGRQQCGDRGRDAEREAGPERDAPTSRTPSSAM